MKHDVSKLLKKFKLTGFKPGDLVITAEIKRVVRTDYKYVPSSDNFFNRKKRKVLVVVDEFPKCEACCRYRKTKKGKKDKTFKKQGCTHEHFVNIGSGGQQFVMALK